MKKTELRRILKPLVQECVRETLLEEGLLSNIISEVVKGTSPLLREAKANTSESNNEIFKKQKMLEQQRQELLEEKQRRIKEQKIKVLNATGFENDIFEGVEPLSQGGSTDSSQQISSRGALSGVDPKDSGVDISGIMAVANRNWKDLI